MNTGNMCFWFVKIVSFACLVCMLPIILCVILLPAFQLDRHKCIARE